MPVGVPAQTDDPVRSHIETGRDFYMRRGSTANGAMRSYLQLFFGFSGGGSGFFEKICITYGNFHGFVFQYILKKVHIRMIFGMCP